MLFFIELYAPANNPDEFIYGFHHYPVSRNTTFLYIWLIFFNVMTKLMKENESYLQTIMCQCCSAKHLLSVLFRMRALVLFSDKSWECIITPFMGSWWKPVLPQWWWVKVPLTYQAITLQLAPERFHGCSFNLVLDILRQHFFPPLVDTVIGNISMIYQKYKIVMKSKWS